MLTCESSSSVAGVKMASVVVVVVPSAGRRRYGNRPTIHRGVDRGAVNKGLEDRSRGTLGDRVVQLADAIVAPANQCQHLAGMGIECDERHLRHGPVLHRGLDLGVLSLPNLGLPGAHLDDLRVHQLHAFIDGFGSGALQVGIDGGVNPQRLLVEVVLAELIGELVLHQVDEIRSIAGLNVRRSQLQRSGFGGVGLCAGDGAGLNHRVEHEVAPLQCTLGMPIRRKIAGPLDDAGNQRAFRKAQVFDVLVEVRARRFAHSHDAVAAALAQRHFVGIHLENLLLRKLLFQVHGDHHLGDLALDRLLRSQEEAARKLHGEGRAALGAMSVDDIGEARFDQAVVVHAVVLEEAAVLDSDDGVDQVFGKIVELDELLLGAVRALEQAGHHHRLQARTPAANRPRGR